MDLGVLYQVSRNLSVDTAVNLGVNSASPTVEWLLGTSFRF